MAGTTDTQTRPVRGLHGRLRQSLDRYLATRPFIGEAVRRIYFGAKSLGFAGSASYWEKRYNSGRSSGAGSFGNLAAFKAEVLNDFVRDNAIKSVVELGCGDGEQLRLASYPSYCGIDVSQAAIDRCRALYGDDPTKSFALRIPEGAPQFDLALSLDVVYHLVEDPVFDIYMRTLFAATRRYAIVYSSNRDALVPEPHVRHRKFTDWVETNLPQWRLKQVLPNRYPYDAGNPATTSFADFFIFELRETS